MKGIKAIIKITSIQPDDNGGSRLELVSEGYIKKLSDGFEISYDETEATGFEGSHTCLTYKNGGYITMNRSGSAGSRLILEQGKRHICRYGTPYGEMNVGVTTSMVSAEIDDRGARMEFHYKIDISSEPIGSHEIIIMAAPEADGSKA